MWVMDGFYGVLWACALSIVRFIKLMSAETSLLKLERSLEYLCNFLRNLVVFATKCASTTDWKINVSAVQLKIVTAEYSRVNFLNIQLLSWNK